MRGDLSGGGRFQFRHDIGALVRSIRCHDDFYLTEAGEASYNASGKKSVKWPIDYAVSSLRLLAMKPKGKNYQILGGSYRSVLDHLSGVGQILHSTGFADAFLATGALHERRFDALTVAVARLCACHAVAPARLRLPPRDP